jgi:hypothetical protein
MTRLEDSVKTVMDILGDLDRVFDDEFASINEPAQGSIYTDIYGKILESLSDHIGDERDDGIAVIPGTSIVGCRETLLVCLFPVYGALGERYPDDVLELRLNQAVKYIKTCPGARNVVFYGPLWDSALWKIHRESFKSCNAYLKLFLAAYTTLKKQL